MDFSKVSFSSFIPAYKEYFKLAKDPSITKYVSFTEENSSLIFFNKKLAGFFRIDYRSDELNDRELYIALLEQFRGAGLAQYVIKTLCNNIFIGDKSCEEIHLSIDKDNTQSINMATCLGFERNTELERELREFGDFRTLIFTIKNRNSNKNITR